MSWKSLLKRKFTTGVSTAYDNLLRIEIVYVDDYHIDMKIGPERSKIFSVRKDTAKGLAEMFAEMHESLTLT